jgi:hypothetical protein
VSVAGGGGDDVEEAGEGLGPESSVGRYRTNGSPFVTTGAPDAEAEFVAAGTSFDSLPADDEDDDDDEEEEDDEGCPNPSCP